MTGGGILFETIVALFLVLAGAGLWFLWNHRPPRLFARGTPSVKREVPARVVSDESAWLQNKVRELLAKNGLKDSDVLKTYNREQREKESQWLEDTLEMKVPIGFDSKTFLRQLTDLLRGRDLRVRSDRRDGDQWVIELGDEERVFERLIFRSSRRQAQTKRPPADYVSEARFGRV